MTESFVPTLGDFDPFKDSLNLCLAELAFIQELINQEGETDDNGAKLEATIQATSELLISEDHYVFSGSQLIAPDIDKERGVVGMEIISGAFVGKFDSITYGVVEDDDREDKFVIYLRFLVDNKEIRSNVLEQTTNQYILAPASSSTIIAPEDAVGELDSLVPEEDDEIIMKMKSLVANGVCDFNGLSVFIRDEFAKLSDMQKEFYTSYLNRLIYIDALIVQSDRYFLYDNDSNLRGYATEENDNLLLGDFVEFMVLETEDTEGQDHNSLFLLLTNEHNSFVVLADDIISIET